jgi:hypothetical protein
MGGNPLTQEVAAKALKKLEAQDETGKGDAHPSYGIYYKGQLVCRTGLRHSPKRDMLVPHVKRDLRVSTPFVLGLARCPISRDDWLREWGLIKDEQDANAEDAAKPAAEREPPDELLPPIES